MKRVQGFTVTEIIVAILIATTGAILFFSGQSTMQSAERDTTRKTAVNAMYYALENSFYQAHAYYPQQIDSKTLPMIDPNLFKDPNGIAINKTGSTLHYESFGCNNDGQCKSYRLEANLEREATYTKDSVHS